MPTRTAPERPYTAGVHSPQRGEVPRHHAGFGVGARGERGRAQRAGHGGVGPRIRSFIHSFVHSFIRSFVLQSHSFVPSFVLQSHSFVHSLTRPIAFVRSLHVVRLNGGIYARSSRVGCRWGEMSARTHRSEGGEATFKTWR